MTRYVIVGAGAIGGGIGGRLVQSGIDVLLVARGDHLTALQQRGLRLTSPEADDTVAVQVVGGPQGVELREDDVLVFATKTHQAPAALAAWADVPVRSGGRLNGTAGTRLPVLMATNGVASEDLALRYFARVFGICVWMPAVHLEAGEVILRAAPMTGKFHVGRVPAALTDGADRALLAELTATWTPAGFAVVLPDDVLAWKYRKLLSNLGNVVQALVGSDGDVPHVVQAADREARSVLDAAGITYTGNAEERAARAQSFSIVAVPGAPPELGGSTWQSLERGTGNVETDYLNGEITLIAHRCGLRAPINTALAALARQAAASAQRPGSITADDLARLLALDDLPASGSPSP